MDNVFYLIVSDINGGAYTIEYCSYPNDDLECDIMNLVEDMIDDGLLAENTRYVIFCEVIKEPENKFYADEEELYIEILNFFEIKKIKR